MHSIRAVGTSLIFIMALLALALLFIGGPEHYDPRSFQTVWNLGHIITFFLWTYLCLLYFHKLRSYTFLKQLCLFAIFALVLGVVIECLQSLIGRDPSWYDVINDILGSVLAVSLLSNQHRQTSHTKQLLVIASLFLAILAHNRELAVVLIDDYHARQQFPVLADFSNRFELSRWQGDALIQIVNDDQLSATSSLKVDLNTHQYSGVMLQHFPSDWSVYSEMRISIYNPATEALRLTCRIHDKAHEKSKQHYDDRFNRQIVLQHGWNNLQIKLEDVIKAPVHRQMDMSDMMAVGLFATQLQQPQTFYIGDVQLLSGLPVLPE